MLASALVSENQPYSQHVRCLLDVISAIQVADEREKTVDFLRIEASV